ncbi:MAG TPA: M14 family zinc carboxypeptidase [Vicinamibacterales bacterium]|jgi:hypothetical protein
MRVARIPGLSFAITASVVAVCVAQAPKTADRPEAGASEAIARFTTETRFLSPWVASVPASDTVPSPTRFLGHVAGAAGELTPTAKIYAYMRALAAASPRVRVETIGRTEEGREILLVAIADEAGIRGLTRLKEATARLADPRRTSPDEAETIIAGARPVYYFNCALHADETGSAEMSMELAYRLAVSEDPMIQNIRKAVLVLVNPVAEPDGHDKMTEWFDTYLKGRREFATLPRQSPPYWNRYVFVDINRDAHQKAFAATRAVHTMFFDYHPTVVHDLHESIALLQTWNGTGPYNPNLDPIVTSEFLEMSLHEVTSLTAMGMPGVWTWKFGESFGLHYLDSVAMNHNAVGRGYETFGNATPETVDRAVGDDAWIGDSPLSREWYRPMPASPAVRWSMRDNVNYQETGALSILDWTARHAADLLRNFYRTGFNSWQKGATDLPRAYVIPAEQNDRLAVAAMVDRLVDQHIEVGRLTADLTTSEGRFARGSYVVKLDQPYRNYAVDVLERQHFPAEAENLPYDDVSWSFPVGFGVTAVRVDDERVRSAPSEPVATVVAPRGSVAGDGAAFLLRDTGQEALLAARFRLARFDVEIAEKSFLAASTDYPAGSWIVPQQTGLRVALAEVAGELALDFVAVAAAPDVPRHAAALPRIGLWVPWADTDAMGWIRYTLDREKVPYTYLRDEDVRAGRLRERVDVVVYGPFVKLDLAAQIHGIPATSGPMAFRRSAETPSLGAPVESDDITGGPGYVGLEAIRRFVVDGGVLLTLGSGSMLPLEGGLVSGVRRASAPDVFTPGSELRVTFEQPNHPIAYGYRSESSVFRGNLPVYDAPRRWLDMAYCTSCLDGPVDRRGVVARWGGSGAMVVSGGMRGEKTLNGHPAVFDLPLGRGRVVAYNFTPIHRDMNRSDYRLLWNAILNWRALGSGPSAAKR